MGKKNENHIEMVKQLVVVVEIMGDAVGVKMVDYTKIK